MSLVISVLAQGILADTNEHNLVTDPTKAVLLETIHLGNVGTGTVKLNVWFVKSGDTDTDATKQRLILPPDLELAAGATFVDSSEITMSPGDKIRVKADVANAIHYQFSGMKRDFVA